MGNKTNTTTTPAATIANATSASAPPSNSKHARKRIAKERDEDLMMIAECYINGDSVQKITSNLNAVRSYQLSVHQIKYDVQKIRKKWHTEAAANRQSLMGEIVQRLIHAANESIAAWKESQIPKKTRTVSRRQVEAVPKLDGETPPKAQVVVTTMVEATAPSNGNPQYMAQHIATLKLLEKVLGSKQPANPE